MLKFPACFNTPTFLVVREVRDNATAVKMLLAAVIRRAAFDIALYRNDERLVNRRLAIQAKRWMFDDREDTQQDQMDRFTSFRSICEILDQDPLWIRKKTLELQAHQVKKFDRVGSF